MKQFLLLIFFFPLLGLGQHFGTTTLPLNAMPSIPAKNTSIVSYLKKFRVYDSLNNDQKEWFYWTSYSRSSPKSFWDSIVAPILDGFPTLKTSNTVSLKQDLYNAGALPIVAPSAVLLTISQSFANEMAAHSSAPSHTSPSGRTFQDRMKEAQIKTCAGENISFGPSNPVLMLVLLYIDQGVANVGHRRALLNPAFTEMGIGVAKYPDNNTIVIQDFSCNQK